MVPSTAASSDDILSIDVGATNIKIAHVTAQAELRGATQRLLTPYPCTPDILCTLLTHKMIQGGCQRIAVGFPGEMDQGVVVKPGNLSRRGGITSNIDPVIDAQWRGFAIEVELRQRSSLDVKVVNDATLAAFGYHFGDGRELVFTLGTGLGISLFIDGQWTKIPDIGSTLFHDEGTYDEVFGEPARRANQTLWQHQLNEAIGEFVQFYQADRVHLGGGNARFFTPEQLAPVGAPVVINSNEATLAGAVRLFLHLPT